MKDEMLHSYRLYAVQDHAKRYIGMFLCTLILLIALLSKHFTMKDSGISTLLLMVIPYGAVMIIYLFMLLPYENWMQQKKNILYRMVPHGYLRWKQSMQMNFYIATTAYVMIWIINMIVLDQVQWDAKGTCLLYGVCFLIVIVIFSHIMRKQSRGATTLCSLLIYPLPVFLFTIVMEMRDVFAAVSWIGIISITVILLVLGYGVFRQLCKHIESVWYL